LKIWSVLAPSLVLILYLPSLLIWTSSLVHTTEGWGSPWNVVGKVTLVPALATVPLGVFVNPGEARQHNETSVISFQKPDIFLVFPFQKSHWIGQNDRCKLFSSVLLQTETYFNLD
jgi:hypothetical protein